MVGLGLANALEAAAVWKRNSLNENGSPTFCLGVGTLLPRYSSWESIPPALLTQGSRCYAIEMHRETKPGPAIEETGLTGREQTNVTTGDKCQGAVYFPEAWGCEDCNLPPGQRASQSRLPFKSVKWLGDRNLLER